MLLIGIARLAAESPVLEIKTTVSYRELETKRWIGRCDSERAPFRWTINPYRGCEYGCKYCYARYTHEFMELSPGIDFETQIFSKQWKASAFASELARVPRGAAIALGTATDPYQPAERRYGITRKMLEIVAQDYGRRLYIATKSDLVQRDLDLLTEISKRNRVIVTMTVTTVDEALARLLEPKAPRPELRLRAIAALARAGVRTSVSMSPILPGLNDTPDAMERVAKAASDAGATGFWAGVVFLKPCSYGVMIPFLKERFPELATLYERSFRNSSQIYGAYPEMIRRRVEELRNRYGLRPREDALPLELDVQLPLFAA